MVDSDSLDAEEVTVQATQALNSIENWSLRNRRLREEFERKRRDVRMSVIGHTVGNA